MRLCDRCGDRPVRMTVRPMGRPDTDPAGSCTRCLGSTVLATVARHGAIVALADREPAR